MILFAERAAWYVVRVSGLSAWFMAACSIVLGLMASSRVLGRSLRPNTIIQLHRWSSAAVTTLLAVHVGALFFEGHQEFSANEIFLPMSTEWRTLGMAAGIVSAQATALIVISALFMRRLPRRLWRGIHLLSYGVFVLSTFHGLSVGTDVGQPLVLLVGGLVTWVILVLAGARVALRQSNGTGPAPRTSISETPLAVGPGMSSAPARNTPGTSRSTGIDLPSRALPCDTLMVPPQE